LQKAVDELFRLSEAECDKAVKRRLAEDDERRLRPRTIPRIKSMPSRPPASSTTGPKRIGSKLQTLPTSSMQRAEYVDDTNIQGEMALAAVKELYVKIRHCTVDAQRFETIS